MGEQLDRAQRVLEREIAEGELPDAVVAAGARKLRPQERQHRFGIDRLRLFRVLPVIEQLGRHRATAEADLKPELEILADDVKCAHGAAIGDLDPESLFYLRSRGVAEAEARALLMRAFLEDAVAEISDETIRANLWSRVEAALQELSA